MSSQVQSGRCVAISLLCAAGSSAVELRRRVIHQFKRRRPRRAEPRRAPASATDPHQLTMKDVAALARSATARPGTGPCVRWNGGGRRSSTTGKLENWRSDVVVDSGQSVVTHSGHSSVIVTLAASPH